MRSYGQYCGLAKALDVVGDRWTLLIVRELLLRGDCRYTDLKNGLPGIATNLLADRLRELEHAGLLAREEAPPPVATALFRLTRRGRELEPALLQLGLWGAPLLAHPDENDAFCTHWLALPLQHLLVDQAPHRPPVAIEVRTGDEPVTLETIGGKICLRRRLEKNPDAVLAGPPHLVLGVLTGKLPLADARSAGLLYEGEPAILRRIQPATKSRQALAAKPK